ncbi:hypothetical protein JCM5296_000394 [Sporobolomyces johnsonii]
MLSLRSTIPTATTPPLFANLTAFFSPLLPPSTRALWCFHGGLLATHSSHIDLFFGVWCTNDDLVDRLRSIGLEVHDHTWLIDSVAKRDKLPLEPYSFSHLDAHACRTACLLPPPRGPCMAAAGSEPCPPTVTRPASSNGPEEATSSIRDNERPSSVLSFSSDSDTSLKTQRRLVSPDKRRAQQILPTPPTGSPHLDLSPPSAQAPPLSPPTTIPTKAEHASLTLDSRPTASSPAAAYSPFFTADLPRSSTRSPPSLPASELFAALSSSATLGPGLGLGLSEGEDGDEDGVRGSDSAEAWRWRWRTGLRVMKHREGGFEVRKISGAGKGTGGGA